MNRRVVAVVALVASVWMPALASEPQRAQARDPRAKVLESLDAGQKTYADVALQIWKFAELGFREQKSSALLQEKLSAAGFTVKSGVADIPTAFVASYGTGKPVVAFVGEFDALPGLSQEAVPERRPVVNGAPGHGCGHNLLGTASMAAAIAVKDWLASTGHAGTVRYYGTPAEEGGFAKTYMLRAGLFDDVDVAVSWHPGDANDASPEGNLAYIGAKFRFHGIASHAAAAPDRGRSALDAVEAMDAMVNLMREHVPQETRIHYIITAGGVAENIVPDFAEASYGVRHPDMRVLEGIWQRVVDAAKGAALGTGTTMDYEVTGAIYNMLPNTYLQGLQFRNLQAVGGVIYTPEERAFAETLRRTLISPELPLGSEAQIQPQREGTGPASSDIGDVSWKVPTSQLNTATWVPGVAAHSWQAVACDGMSIGAKGMMVAARAMALTGLDLFLDPAHIVKARAEFDRRRGGTVYAPKIGDKKPPLDYRK